MKHRIIENFLPEETFKKIADHIYTPSFGWGYNECVAFEEPSKDDNFYFTHELYNWGAPKCTFFLDIIKTFFNQTLKRGFLSLIPD